MDRHARTNDSRVHELAEPHASGIAVYANAAATQRSVSSRILSVARGHRAIRVIICVAIILIPLLGIAAPFAHAWSRFQTVTGPHFATNPSVINELANPGDPPQQSTLQISNTGTATLHWSLTSSLPSWLALDTTAGSLGPGASQTVNLTFTLPNGTPQTYSTTLVFTDPNANNSPYSVPASLTVGNYSRTWYFAEGYTGGSFTTYLTLANPNPQPANVTVKYYLGAGLPLSASYSILSNARYTVNVNNVVGPGANVSMVVTSTVPIIAERPMYFTYTSIPGIAVPGGSDTLGATSLNSYYFFGYVDTTVAHNTYFTVLNQNSAAIDARIQYYPASGGQPYLRIHKIAASSRGTVSVNSESLPQGTYSAYVNLVSDLDPSIGALGLVERPMYFKDNITGYTGASDVIGVSFPSQTWYFAEGYTSSTFSERYVLSNPGNTSTRAVLTFFKSDGNSVSTTVSLAPGQQTIINANNILGSSGVNNSAEVQADQEILAERVISFRYVGPVGAQCCSSIPGATDVLGATALSTLYYFAEGYSGGQFGEWLTIENPDLSNSVTVTVTFLPDSGANPTVKTYTIGPSRRFTLFTNSVMPSQSFSMTVASSGPIVAERPMYFAYNGSQTGGTDVVGFTPLVSPTQLPLFCNDCTYPTTDTLLGGGLDSSTGLLQWSYPTDVSLIGSPLLANQGTSSETLYAASDSFPESIFALDPFSGAVEWRDNLSTNQIVDIGGSIGNTGMAVGDGLLFAGISDQSNNRWLYAYNASTGAFVWRVAVDNDMETTPVVINGIVYMGTFAGTLYAINDSSGTIAWSIPDASYIFGTSPFGAYANGIIYTGVGTNFDALNATTGAVIWSVQDNLFPPVIMVGNTLYSNDGFGGVIALNTSDGSTIWDKQLSGFNLFAQQAANGAVYGSASDINNNTSVFALDGSTGNLLWRTAVSAQIEYLTVTSDTLYFGTSDGYMYSLNAGDGSVNWKFQAVSAPVLGPYIVVDTSSSITAIFAAYTGSSLYVYGVDPTSGAQIWVTQLDITGGYIPGIAMNNVLNGPSIARSATARGQPRCHVAGCAGE